MHSDIEVPTQNDFYPDFYLYETWLKDNFIKWADFAPCVGRNPLFFPQRRSKDAGCTICATCTYRTDCAEYAVVFKERDGIWGGLLEGERDQLTEYFDSIEKATWSQQDRNSLRSLAEEAFFVFRGQSDAGSDS